MKIEELKKNIGKTPLIRLENIEKLYKLPFEVYGKLERNNPSGSIKDRAAIFMIEKGIEDGKINKDTTIVEATSGNIGISLAMISANLGLKCKIFMPESASKERRTMMKAYGADVILVQGSMSTCVDAVRNELKKNPNAFNPSQFENEANIKAHFEGTSLEILNDLGCYPDFFVAGFGTAGTLMGCAKRFKEKTYIIGVEPMNSPLLTERKSGPHKIQGIGANFIPKLFDQNLVDEIYDVSDEDSYKFTRLLAKVEGLFVGISSGAALAAVVNKKRDFKEGSKVVIILPDNGERYLSVEGLYD